ncbi:MAG: LysE family translocator [Proteobacteria bacterium]|nr:LysE family translocator [Pseudomonadota bacterium]
MVEILPLAVYVFVMSITPGPNNVMVTASGAMFGYRRTIPHLLGVSIGCAVQTVMVTLGLGIVFQRYPSLHEFLAWAGTAYLIYLGWRIFASGFAAERSEERARPISFLEAVLFQFLNPKAWMIAITTATVFLPKDFGVLAGSAVIVLVLIVVNYPCISLWTLFGTAIGRYLTDAYRRRIFNGILALALVATGLAMVLF